MPISFFRKTLRTPFRLRKAAPAASLEWQCLVKRKPFRGSDYSDTKGEHYTFIWIVLMSQLSRVASLLPRAFVESLTWDSEKNGDFLFVVMTSPPSFSVQSGDFSPHLCSTLPSLAASPSAGQEKGLRLGSW